MKRIVIGAVQPNSAAAEAGIEPGDMLLSINGRKIEDIFDYRYLSTDRNLIVEIEKSEGEVWKIEIEKDEYEELGLEFEDPLISGARSCRNKCIFCFVDQLPKGMRETLYFKDDDSRLSFLSGNYVTLTNVSKRELERIIRYKMSPVNVSVHTTNPELRKKMLCNRFAGDVVDKIRLLVGGGIAVNAQIVLCRGINDGDELDRTLGELSSMHPGLASISVVPVGLTKWREGLYPLEHFDEKSADAVIEQVEAWQKRLLREYGTRIAYLADEFYIKAGRELPSYSEYEDFPQLENGVGLMSLFIYEFHDYLKRYSRRLDRHAAKMAGKRTVSIATGFCAYKYIKQLAQTLEKRYNNLEVKVYPIKNEFFGETVTVTGLLTGSDLLRQLSDCELGDELLLSESMLKSGERLLLDGYTVEKLEATLGRKITIVRNTGEEFIRKLLGV